MSQPHSGGVHSFYDYVPSFAAGVVFLVLFGLSTLIQVGQSIRYRMWWLLPTVVLGGIGELLGWAARTWSAKSPALRDPFIMQITATIISPTFMLAANFIIVGKLIQFLGPQYSRLKPRMYTIVFFSCDLIALVVQAIGGGKASAGTATGDREKTKSGGNIMLGGIIFQMIAIFAYTVVTFEFIIRLLTKKPFNRPQDPGASQLSEFNTKLKLMVAELALCSVLLLIRSVYRTIELADGWNGTVIATQWLFIVFDGAMIAAVMISLNVLHPGMLLKPSYGSEGTVKQDVMPLRHLPPSVRSSGATVEEKPYARA